MSRVFERERRREGKKKKKERRSGKEGHISRNISSENMFFFFNERSKREREIKEKVTTIIRR